MGMPPIVFCAAAGSVAAVRAPRSATSAALRKRNIEFSCIGDAYDGRNGPSPIETGRGPVRIAAGTARRCAEASRVNQRAALPRAVFS
jgi:hypothetical protein